MTDTEKDGWMGTINGRPEVGQSAERSRTTSMQDILAFTEMTGDRNPVHYDRELAEKTAFGKLIVQGGVTTGILNACVAEDLPGPGRCFSASNGNSSRLSALTRRSSVGSRWRKCAQTSRSASCAPRCGMRPANCASTEPQPPTPCRLRGCPEGQGTEVGRRMPVY